MPEEVEDADLLQGQPRRLGSCLLSRRVAVHQEPQVWQNACRLRLHLTFNKTYASTGPDPYGGPIVVIVDGLVRSAGETATGIFKEDGRAYMIGESATAGMSAVKKTIELPSRLFALYVAVASNKGRFNQGRGIEGIGVIPHEIVLYDPADLSQGKDTLIRRAETLLRDFPQSKVPYLAAQFGWKATQ